jgi:hypothetical protein
MAGAAKIAKIHEFSAPERGGKSRSRAGNRTLRGAGVLDQIEGFEVFFKREREEDGISKNLDREDPDLVILAAGANSTTLWRAGFKPRLQFWAARGDGRAPLSSFAKRKTISNAGSCYPRSTWSEPRLVALSACPYRWTFRGSSRSIRTLPAWRNGKRRGLKILWG